MTFEPSSPDESPVAGRALPAFQPVGPTPGQARIRTYLCGGWSVIEAAGEIDLAVAPMLREVLHDTSTSDIVFDLHGVEFIDCSGLGILAEAQRGAGAAGGSVRLVAPTRAVRRLLEVARLDTVFDSYASVEEATRLNAVDHLGEALMELAALVRSGSGEQLTTAIDGHTLIGQAQGILMERFGIGPDQASTVLERYSQDTDTKLRDIAEQLVRPGNLLRYDTVKET